MAQAGELAGAIRAAHAGHTTLSPEAAQPLFKPSNSHRCLILILQSVSLKF